MRQCNPRMGILVTAGPGFLGAHLIDRLSERGDGVVCADSLCTGNKRVRVMGVRRGEDGEPDYPGPISLGIPNEFAICQLAERVIQLTGSQSQIVFRPGAADDPMQLQPNIARPKGRLGDSQPQVQLEERSNKTIAYFDQLLTEVA